MRKKQLLFRKLRFYNQNKLDINTLAQSEKDWTDIHVKEFIKRAREDIGYSKKTSPCDIFSSLIKLTPYWEKKRRQRWTR